MVRRVMVICVLVAALSAAARAEEIEEELDESGEPDDEEVPAGPADDALARRLEELEQRLAIAGPGKVDGASRVRLTGYGDVGFFAPQGDGSGVRMALQGDAVMAEHPGFGWVFYGDILSTAVNSRGDAADLGDLPGVSRTDAIASRGNPTFLVNELNLGLRVGISEDALFTASVNFTPRSGHDFSLGDTVDADVVELEWMPTGDGRHSIFVGKVESVLGHEYKLRRSNQRFGITPSLLARYTAGTAVGVKARSKLFGEHVVLSGAVTNGSFGVEQFHFYDEIDTNAFKTLSGRAALRAAVLGGQLEVGASGEWGAQDGSPNGDNVLWVAGLDLEWTWPSLAVRAQWLRAGAPGDAMSGAYGLILDDGAYLEVDTLVRSWLGLYARAELRDALVWQGTDRIYVTKSYRATGGFRLVLGPRVTAKAEVLWNGEYGGLPQIPNNLITTSMVLDF